MKNKMFHKIKKCRVCKNEHLTTVLDLGDQYLSGFFPKKIDPDMYKGPLKLVKCDETTGGCGHVQLKHTFDLPTMYGDDYGYRSGLNNSMIKHLQSKYERIVKFLKLKDNDLVIDIAGNDGTFLGFFPSNLKLVSIDPTSKKFSKYFGKDSLQLKENPKYPGKEDKPQKN
jgi:NDP-4-keto-2,6-dideoxyhexose 3-C-methyltransferase